MTGEEALNTWVARLGAAGVAHAGVQVTSRAGSALMAFRAPGSIQLEMCVQIARRDPQDR